MALTLSSPTPTVYGQSWPATYNGANPHIILVDTRAGVLAVQVAETVDGVTRYRTERDWPWTLGSPTISANATMILRMVTDYWHARTGNAPT